MPNANLLKPAELFPLPQRISEKTYCRVGRWPTVESTDEVNPEYRLWKVCMETDSWTSGTIEWIVFLFFGALAIVETVPSFSELFHLLFNGSLEHTAQALLTR